MSRISGAKPRAAQADAAAPGWGPHGNTAAATSVEASDTAGATSNIQVEVVERGHDLRSSFAISK